MTFRSIRSIFIVLLLFKELSFGQFNLGESPQKENYAVSFEAIPVFLTDTTRAFVNIHYRIPEDFFIYVRGLDPMKNDVFTAKGELIVELIDEKGISASRQIQPIVRTRTFPPSQRFPGNEIEGFLQMEVKEGTHKIHFRLDDEESGRTFLNTDHKVTTRKPSNEPLDLSFPLFALRTIGDIDTQSTFTAINYGTHLLFGTPSESGYLFQVNLLSDQQPLTVEWTLRNERKSAGLEEQSFRGNTYQLLRGFPQIQIVDNSIRYFAAPTPTQWHLLFVPLPLEKLDNGRGYLEITVSQESFKKDLKYSFDILWPNRPLSLRSIDFAIDALQIIAKPDELDKLKTTSFVRRAKAFYEFWRNRDRDTSTAYNELMVEYYRRVDHSMKEYSVSRDTDGYKTDRGRIYILYGPPTKMERFLNPNGIPTEMWTYENTKKRFLFSDPRKTGLYSLASIEDL